MTKKQSFNINTSITKKELNFVRLSLQTRNASQVEMGTPQERLRIKGEEV